MKYYNTCWYCGCEFRAKYPHQENCGNCVPAIKSTEPFGKNYSVGNYHKEKLYGYQSKRELEALKEVIPIPELIYGTCREICGGAKKGVKPPKPGRAKTIPVRRKKD